MMLSKKNSEALENFSEKLEVEGRSLWQDARRRFMHNRAAVASLIVLVIIALFVTLRRWCRSSPISIPTGA
jgi:oligopeptide transport system permease protein